jgi:glycosyltransferase involved in cell wall biosynthesis
MRANVLIVIPCYNEEEALPFLLRDLDLVIRSSPHRIKTLVVNDCSKDQTARIARNAGVGVLDLSNNLGIGGAVQAGLKYAHANRFDYAVQMDGDGQHPPSELEKLIQTALDTGADIVIGSRFITGEGFQSSFIRRLGIRYFYAVNRLLTRKRIHDSTSGFRLLGSKAIALATRYYPDDYPEPESLVMFAKSGLEVREVPVCMRHRQGGKSSICTLSSLYYWLKVTLSMLYTYIRKW